MTHQVRSRRLALSIFVVGMATLCGALRPAFASIVPLNYTQNFPTAAANLAAAQAAYPDLTFDNAASATTTVAGGVLHLNDSTNAVAAVAWVTPTLNNLVADVIVDADITASNSNGGYNVGFELGVESSNTNYEKIIFHPGFLGGAFRISVLDNGGGTNVDMGYTPANNDPQHVHLDIDSAGLVNITITDSANPSNVFTASFTDARVYGASVALLRSGDSPGFGDGQYSNFSITQAVPEPASASLFIVGGVALLRRRRAKKPSSQGVGISRE